MDLSRKSFLKGLFASAGLGAFGDWRVFAAPDGWTPPGAPELSFGVISDTHLRTSANGLGRGKYWPDKYLVAALEYFRDQNVDAVVNCGDMAHRGQVLEQVFHAEAWQKTFPDNRAPDGHAVEKLFVNGNHDVEGAGYGDFVAKAFPDPGERAKRVLVSDMAANWERIWGEPYSPVWHKTVKGYHFFGRHHGVDEMELAGLVKAKEKECGLSSGKKPFFLISHVRPHGALNRALRPYKKGVAFFGHWHHSAANWNNIYFWSSFPAIQVPSCEPRGCRGQGECAGVAKAKLEGVENLGSARQGYLVRVYGDMLVISRREFGLGGSLGSDWIMPFGRYGAEHPFSKAELKKRIGKPQFRKGAKLEISALDTPAPALKIGIPLADGATAVRCYAYDVEVAGDRGKKLLKSVFAVGGNLPAGREPDGGVTSLSIPFAELPKGGRLSIAVRPITSLGTSGEAVSATFRRSTAKG